MMRQKNKTIERQMTQKGGKRGPLVAERRYPKSNQTTPAKGGTTRKRIKVGKAKPAILTRLLSPLVWAVRLVWRLAWKLAAVTALMIGVAVWYYASQMPPLDEMVDGRTRGSVTFLDRDGQTFAWRGDQFGGMITAETVSPHLRNAVIATEDKRFYKFYHFGVDFYATGAAMVRNYNAGGNPLSGAGGSSLSQQTAKLLCFGVAFDPAQWDSERDYEADCRRTTLWRKVKEAVYAFALEARYTKDEILTIYLNRVYMGGGARGAEAAAERFFGISAAEVNPAQAAMMAGLIKSPSVLAPTSNLKRSQERAATVVRLMREQGYLSESAAAEAQENPATLSEAAEARRGGYYANWALEKVPAFLVTDTTEDLILRTTFDQRIQTAAEEAIKWLFTEKVMPTSTAEAAIVVMSPDGAVRAMVGGRDPSGLGFNRASQARRQTGSVFKPFVFATALELGFSPYDLISDSPLTITIPGSGTWEPKNYDRQFKGNMTLTQALAESRNIPAVVLSEEVGRELVRDIAAGFGIRSDLAAGPALALGVSESTLIEMTGAYAGFLNGGSSVTPYALTELTMQGEAEPLMTHSGNGMGERVINERAARQLTWMLTQVVENGTGTRAQMDGWPIAAKTGTTQGQRDAWFIGFTGDYVVGVWMGKDDNSPLNGVTGGGLPADLWRETMRRIVAGWQPTGLPLEVPVNRSTSPPISNQGITVDREFENVIDNILLGIIDQ